MGSRPVARDAPPPVAHVTAIVTRAGVFHQSCGQPATAAADGRGAARGDRGRGGPPTRGRRRSRGPRGAGRARNGPVLLGRAPATTPAPRRRRPPPAACAGPGATPPPRPPRPASGGG